MIRDMGFPDYIGSDPNNVSIKEDNQGSLVLVKNPHLHECSKYIDIQCHYIQDLEEKDKIVERTCVLDRSHVEGLRPKALRS